MVKFEGDGSNQLEIMTSQTQGFGKVIRPLFADPVMHICICYIFTHVADPILILK